MGSMCERGRGSKVEGIISVKDSGGQVANNDKSGERQASCWNACIIQQFVYGDWLEVECSRFGGERKKEARWRRGRNVVGLS